jgi:hypothetical protein
MPGLFGGPRRPATRMRWAKILARRTPSQPLTFRHCGGKSDGAGAHAGRRPAQRTERVPAGVTGRFFPGASDASDGRPSAARGLVPVGKEQGWGKDYDGFIGRVA